MPPSDMVAPQPRLKILAARMIIPGLYRFPSPGLAGEREPFTPGVMELVGTFGQVSDDRRCPFGRVMREDEAVRSWSPPFGLRRALLDVSCLLSWLQTSVILTAGWASRDSYQTLGAFVLVSSRYSRYRALIVLSEILCLASQYCPRRACPSIIICLYIGHCQSKMCCHLVYDCSRLSYLNGTCHAYMPRIGAKSSNETWIPHHVVLSS